MMATRGPGRSQASGKMYSFEPLDKLASSTLKRHPKMELNKTDLLKLLSVLEAELQAREIVIAVLKAEQVKQLLYPKRKPKKSCAPGADPLSALQRDVFGAFDPNFDEGSVKAAYNVQLHQLELLITLQRKAQDQLREQLRDANEKYAKAMSELDDERRKHAQDTAQGDDVTYLLEKERERLRQEVDFERQQNKRLEKEAQRLSDTLEEERLKQKQIVLLLLAERKRLILRLLEERQQYGNLSDILHDEKTRMADMVEGLEEESKKSLQMEAEMERQLSEFDYERESYKVQISAYDLKNQELINEVERLQTEIEIMKQQQQMEQRPIVNLGEGVRSTIVTMATTPPAIRAIPTVTPTVSPPRNMAKPVSPKGTVPVMAPATPIKPPGLVAHVPPKMAVSTAVGKPVPVAQPSSAVPVTLSAPLTSSSITISKGAKSLKPSTPALPPRAVSPSPIAASIPDGGIVSPAAEGVPETNPEESTTSVSAAVKLFAGQAKSPVGTVAVAQPRKVAAAIGRGTPPPVPPNKPILAPQALLRKDLGPKPPVPPRGSTNEGEPQRSPRPNSSIVKPEKPLEQVENWHDPDFPTTEATPEASTTTPANSNQADETTMEIFGQELADFQQLFVSMANGKHTKRIQAKKRYKIEKKIREHHRKVRKQAKKNPGKNRNKPPKDIGVPNSLPFKLDVLNEIQEKKKQLEELKAQQKEERQKMYMENRGLQDVQTDAQNRAKEFEKREEEKFMLTSERKSNEKIRQQSAHNKEFQKVVESSDIILEVLDARDPLGTRCSTVEHAVISSSTDKKLVLVLNKIDLVPRENLMMWLKYLRNYFPTVPFKASTQLQKKKLARTWVPIASGKGHQMSNCLGAEALMKVLGSYTRSGDIRKTVTVGIVGFPNVGKSSLINSLKRCKACNVGATPGVTKFKQTIRLDKHITLLDSPGVILAKTSASAGEAERTAIVLKNVVRIEALEDPVTPAESIIQRANREQLMRFYKLPAFSDANHFLVLFAKRFARLKKGGVPNIKFAARTILQDWNVGKIKYYTEPPEENSCHLGTEIVEKLSQPFDLKELYEDQENELKGLKVVLPSEAIQVQSFGISEAKDSVESMQEQPADNDDDDNEDEEEDEVEEMEVQDRSRTVVRFEDKKSDKKAGKEKTKERLKTSRLQVPQGLKHHESEEGDQLNKARKMKFKHFKRQKKRAEKLATKLSEELEGSMNLEQENYSFAVDHK